MVCGPVKEFFYFTLITSTTRTIPLHLVP